jgi:prevent-host-death family protein
MVIPFSLRLDYDYIDHYGQGGGSMTKKIWTVAEAKARFSELLAEARKGEPQTITRHGRTEAVVVSAEEWERKTRRSGSLAEFFASSPLRGSSLAVGGEDADPREVEL